MHWDQNRLFEPCEPRSDARTSRGDEDPRYLRDQILTYIGNKRSLLDYIGQPLRTVQQRLGKKKVSFFDVFTGSGVVARLMRRHSDHIVTGDLEDYAEVVARCYLSNLSSAPMGEIQESIEWLNHEACSRLAPGFIAELYAPQDDVCIKLGERVFYTQRNARFLDTARMLIDGVAPHLRNFLLAPLLYCASVNANTAGVFKGFYKNRHTGIGQFGGTGENALSRITKDIIVPVPVMSRFECAHTHLKGDANEYVRQASEVDLAYLDPPYNQHPYGSNYFMLNLLVNYSRPTEVSEVSGIPTNWKRSGYNKKGKALDKIRDLLGAVKAKFLLFSFNSEGFIDHATMQEELGRLGKVETFEAPYIVFRGSRNLHSRPSKVVEYLYLLERH